MKNVLKKDNIPFIIIIISMSAAEVMIWKDGADVMDILTGILTACIGAAVTLTGSYFAYLGNTQKILRILEEFRGERYQQLREDGKGILQKSERLSAEHNGLREELYKIHMNQETEKAARNAATKAIPEEGKLLDLVKVVFQHHMELTEKNAELMQEVMQLKKELALYREMDISEGMDSPSCEMEDDDLEI